MKKREVTLSLALIALGVPLLSSVAHATDNSLIGGVLGGQMWDKWWVVTANAEPAGDHPLYPAIGQKTGSTTWRCKECHGWDYKGRDGAYSSGSHFTGIKGVFGSTLTGEEMFDLLKEDTLPYGHGLGNAGLNDDEIDMLVGFLQNYVINTDTYIDPTNLFIGDEAMGRFGYKAVGGSYTCAECHGDDGAEINFGTELDPTYVHDIAVGNPWELMHKVRFGQPGTLMTSWLLMDGDNQGAADVGRYLQADFPAAPYAGDQACSGCHANWPAPDFFGGYARSGHPFKLFHAAGDVPPLDTWPHTALPPLPVVGGVQLVWSDIEYVIGNYNWKARFVDHDGFIYTGNADETTQWNLATQDWVPYHAGEVDKPYNCGRCHTTGYDPTGNQLGLPGLIGTWEQEGVRCEACHGPASDHVAHPMDMLPPGGKDCAECHYRDSQFRMPWKGGFTRHHQQAEDFEHSPHRVMLECNTCHNPHRSTVYDDGGVITACTDCHAGNSMNGFYVVDEMEFLDCIDCHMPHMGKNAVAVNQYKGDIRAHLFRINASPLFAVDNVYEDGGSLYWNQENGHSSLTLDYACLGCHIEMNEPLTMVEAAQYAVRIHTAHPATTRPILKKLAGSDVNSDGTIDILDMLRVIGSLGPCIDCDEDVDSSGAVDVTDVIEVFNSWSNGLSR